MSSLEPVLSEWAKRNDLISAYDSWAGEKIHCYHLSSEQGECYQISLTTPKNDEVSIRIRCIEGRYDLEEGELLIVPIENLSEGLHDAIEKVYERMLPSKRHFYQASPS